MSKSIAIVVGTVVLLAAGMPLAQDVKIPAAGSAATATQSASPKMGQMDEHMKKMQALHEKLATATTPDERQRLMTEQRQEMQQGMAMMHDMHHSGPMTGAEGKGMQGKVPDQETQMRMMDQRMDMMQMMMQSMMDQQSASGSGTMPAPLR